MAEKGKIVHICMTQYSDGWTYQDNLLTKYHKILGYDVTVITSMFCYREGVLTEDTKTDFRDVNGVRIIRLRKKSQGLMKKTPTYWNFLDTLENICPDIIFSHGCQYRDTANVVQYMKNHPAAQLFVDNHADFSNSATNFISKNVLHKIIWKYYAQKLVPYAKKFFGVLPARVRFLTDIYGIPKEKCELLIMGADDEMISKMGTKERGREIRKKYGIAESDFLVVTGGKIDKAKKQTGLLMEAVSNIDDAHLKLLVFGSIDPEIKNQLMKWIDDKKIIYGGWITPDQSYEYFAAADLVVFPGRHSVFWEQVAGQGIPLLVKWWDGTTHINKDGNAEFLYEDSVEEIIKKIEYIRENYAAMKKAAMAHAREFLYSEIAKKSLQ